MNTPDLVVELQVGAHLYGTATALSDHDYAAVYLPDGRDILLQRVRLTIHDSRVKILGERNQPADVDRQFFSLQRYFELLAEGQTLALDMLFAPDAAMTRPPTPLWRDIQAHASRLVTRRATALLGYCGQQAKKYGVKGARLAAVREARDLVEAAVAVHGPRAPLACADAALQALAGMNPHVEVPELPGPGDRPNQRFLAVCGKRLAFTASLGSAATALRRMVDDFGARTRVAEAHAGADWKALSHAVRIGREGLELFETGRITLPPPYAAEILAIKQGRVPFAAVAETIEALLLAVETAAARSTLPDAPDQAFIEDRLLRAYRAKVLAAG